MSKMFIFVAMKNRDDKRPFGTALKKIRQQLGFTQFQVAQRMGVLQTGISHLEKYTSNPSIRSLERYANAMNCKLILQIVPR